MHRPWNGHPLLGYIWEHLRPSCTNCSHLLWWYIPHSCELTTQLAILLHCTWPDLSQWRVQQRKFGSLPSPYMPIYHLLSLPLTAFGDHLCLWSSMLLIRWCRPSEQFSWPEFVIQLYHKLEASFEIRKVTLKSTGFVLLKFQKHSRSFTYRSSRALFLLLRCIPLKTKLWNTQQNF